MPLALHLGFVERRRSRARAFSPRFAARVGEVRRRHVVGRRERQRAREIDRFAEDPCRASRRLRARRDRIRANPPCRPASATRARSACRARCDRSSCRSSPRSRLRRSKPAASRVWSARLRAARRARCRVRCVCRDSARRYPRIARGRSARISRVAETDQRARAGTAQVLACGEAPVRSPLPVISPFAKTSASAPPSRRRHLRRAVEPPVGEDGNDEGAGSEACGAEPDDDGYLHEQPFGELNAGKR